MLKSLKSRIDAAGCFSIIILQIKVKQVSLFGFLFYDTTLHYFFILEEKIQTSMFQ